MINYYIVLINYFPFPNKANIWAEFHGEHLILLDLISRAKRYAWRDSYQLFVEILLGDIIYFNQEMTLTGFDVFQQTIFPSYIKPFMHRRRHNPNTVNPLSTQ